MALSPQIHLKQGQQLAMTPQLQQAIKLLQLSNIELAAFVEEQVEGNPLLEHGTGTDNRRTEDTNKVDADTALPELNLSTPNQEAADAIDAPQGALEADATAADLAPSAPSVGGEIDWSKSGSGGSFNGSVDYDASANTAQEITLREHLNAQLALEVHDEKTRLIGSYLIDNVDENGYLQGDLQAISDRLGVSLKRVEVVLAKTQGFEPTGVLARNLKECLSLQLEERGDLNTHMQGLLDNLQMLAAQDLPQLAKLCNLSLTGLKSYIERLRMLAPKPGLAFGSDTAAIVEPDVFVREQSNGSWAVELNSETLPRVLINARYFAEVCGSTKDKKVQTYMSDCQQNASWLVKSLDQRARTILKVSSEIVKQQDGFFAYGVDHLRPLNLRTVADAIEMHESTVSRVTSNKYMSTPRGVFELKYFFTSAIASLDGGDALSAEAVQA